PIISPSQDIVMGCYYLTATRGELGESGEAGEDKVFSSPVEVLSAFGQRKLGVHARVHVRLPMGSHVIKDPGDSYFEEGQIVSFEEFAREKTRIHTEGGSRKKEPTVEASYPKRFISEVRFEKDKTRTEEVQRK